MKAYRKGYRVEHTLVEMFQKDGFRASRVPLSGATSFAKGDIELWVCEKKYKVEVKARKEGFEKLYRLVNNQVLLADDLAICTYPTFVSLLKQELIPLKPQDIRISKQIYKWLEKADILIVKANYKPYLVIIPKETLGGMVNEELRHLLLL